MWQWTSRSGTRSIFISVTETDVETDPLRTGRGRDSSRYPGRMATAMKPHGSASRYCSPIRFPSPGSPSPHFPVCSPLSSAQPAVGARFTGKTRRRSVRTPCPRPPAASPSCPRTPRRFPPTRRLVTFSLFVPGRVQIVSIPRRADFGNRSGLTKRGGGGMSS